MKHPLSVVLLTTLAIAACSKAPMSAAQDDDHGPTKPVGDLTVGAHTFAVSQGESIEAGKEALVFAAFAAGKPVPSTMRAWIGVESGTGSMKAKMSKEDERTMHAHVQVPKPIPEGSKIWIEIEDGTNVQRGSIAWK